MFEVIFDLLGEFAQLTAAQIGVFIILGVGFGMYSLLSKIGGNRFGNALGILGTIPVVGFFLYLLIMDNEKFTNFTEGLGSFILLIILAGFMLFFSIKNYQKNKDDYWAKLFLSFSIFFVSATLSMQFSPNGILAFLLNDKDKLGQAMSSVLGIISLAMVISFLATFWNLLGLFGIIFHAGPRMKIPAGAPGKALFDKNSAKLKVLKKLKDDIKTEIKETDVLFKNLEHYMGVKK